MLSRGTILLFFLMLKLLDELRTALDAALFVLGMLLAASDVFSGFLQDLQGLIRDLDVRIAVGLVVGPHEYSPC